MAIPAGTGVCCIVFPFYNTPELYHEYFYAGLVDYTGLLQLCALHLNDGAYSDIYNCMLGPLMCYSLEQDSLAYARISVRVTTILQQPDPALTPYVYGLDAVTTSMPKLGPVWQSETSGASYLGTVLSLSLLAILVVFLISPYNLYCQWNCSILKDTCTTSKNIETVLRSSPTRRMVERSSSASSFAQLTASVGIWWLRRYLLFIFIVMAFQSITHLAILKNPTALITLFAVYLLSFEAVAIWLHEQSVQLSAPYLQHISALDSEIHLLDKSCGTETQHKISNSPTKVDPGWQDQENSTGSSTTSSRSSSSNSRTTSSRSSTEEAYMEPASDRASSISEDESLDDIAIELQQSFIDIANNTILPSIIQLVFSTPHTGTGQNRVPNTSGNGSGGTRQDSRPSRPSIGNSAHDLRRNKRLRAHDEGDPNDEEEKESAPDGSSSFDPNKTTFRKLACPFHKNDPRKYREGSVNGKQYKTCPRGFKDTKDLSDHLKDIHRGPKFLCKRCSATFKTEDAATQHQRQIEPCELWVNPEFEIEGYIMSDERCKALKKKLPSKSIEEHWFAIWDVLFPNQERPKSIYQDFEQLENAFNQAIEIAIPTFIEQQIRAAGWSDYDADYYLRRFAETLRQHLWDRYEAEVAARLATTTVPPSAMDPPGGGAVTSRTRARTNNVGSTFQHSAINPYAASHENVHDSQNNNTDRDSVHPTGHYTSQNQDISFWTQQQRMATPAIGQGISTSLFPRSSNQANITSTDDALPDLVPNNDDLFDLYDRWNQE